MYLDIWRLPAQQFEAIVRRFLWVASFVLFTAVLSPIRDFTQRNDLPISGLTASFVFSAVLWVWTPYLLLGRRLPWRRLAPTGLLTVAAVAIYSIGCEIFLPDSFTTNAQRYGLIGIAFGIVTYLFGFASLVVVTAIVAGAWDRLRALELSSKVYGTTRPARNPPPPCRGEACLAVAVPKLPHPPTRRLPRTLRFCYFPN